MSAPDARPLQAAEEWQATFDALSHGVLMLDAASVVLRANAAAAALLGIDPDRIAGRACRDILPAASTLERLCERAAAAPGPSREPARLHDDGRGRVLLGQAAVLPPGLANGARVILSLVDVTELERSRLELRRSRDAFFNMLRDLDASNRELRDLSDSLILAFVNVLEAKSPWTRGHSERVTAIAVEIGRTMGLGPRELEDLRVAGFLHDIGKVGVFAQILEKPGPLTDIEMELIRLHPAKGVEILAPISQLESILPIVRHHHERMDGRGYPDGLAGAAIPLPARILAVADAYDAMISSRPYRPGMGRTRAIEEVRRVRGTQLDPDVVDAFLGLPRTAVEAVAFLRRKAEGGVN